MKIFIYVTGILSLLALLWFLSVALEKIFLRNSNDQSTERVAWLENFIRWAGERQPATPERVGFSILWLVFLLSLIDHLHSRSGFTGTLIYFLALLPHEAGHFICIPFGWFFSVAGGSIWQVLLFVLFGFIVLYRKRRNEALGWWAVTGHSLISLSAYIADASTRSLALIPIPDPSRHDWGNMLEYLGLLQYDWLLAQLAVAIGGGIVLSAVIAGLFFTWYQPQVFTS